MEHDSPNAAMNLAVFSARTYDEQHLSRALVSHPRLSSSLTISYHFSPLSLSTIYFLSPSTYAVCTFVNDDLSAPVLEALYNHGVRAILLRCAGYNNVDLPAAEALGLFVANVPAYSPEAVAEFAVALIQTLNRKTHRAYNRVREGNFSLDGLVGHTLHGKTLGIVGTGRIGLALAKIMRCGFGCEVLAYDPYATSKELEMMGGSYVAELEDLLSQSNVVSLHCPLTPGTRQIINEKSLRHIKRGALLVNTSRGGLIDTSATIQALKEKRLGGLALDVYEAESGLFYNDHSMEVIEDDTLMRLMTFPNVLVCSHQAFLTQEALDEIADTVLRNLDDFMLKRSCANLLVEGGKLHVKEDTKPVRF